MNNAVTNRDGFTVLRNSSVYIKPLKLDSVLGLPPGTSEKYAIEKGIGYEPELGISESTAVLIVIKFAFETTPPTWAARNFSRHLMAIGMKAYIFSEAGFY
jgi:hypothetical protein